MVTSQLLGVAPLSTTLSSAVQPVLFTAHYKPTPLTAGQLVYKGAVMDSI